MRKEIIVGSEKNGLGNCYQVKNITLDDSCNVEVSLRARWAYYLNYTRGSCYHQLISRLSI